MTLRKNLRLFFFLLISLNNILIFCFISTRNIKFCHYMSKCRVTRRINSLNWNMYFPYINFDNIYFLENVLRRPGWAFNFKERGQEDLIYEYPDLKEQKMNKLAWNRMTMIILINTKFRQQLCIKSTN